MAGPEDDLLSPQDPQSIPETRNPDDTGSGPHEALVAEEIAPAEANVSGSPADSATDTALIRPEEFMQPASDRRARTRIIVTPRPELFGEGEARKPELAERARLNAVDSFYRGTLAGAFYLSNLYKLSHLQEREEETPERKAQIEFHRPQYEKIRRDLGDYDQMAGFESVGDAAAAFAGQLGASLLTPETYIATPVRGATLAMRAISAGLGRAGIELLTDPLVQWQSIKARVQEGYNPFRTGERAAMGFVAGAGLHAAGSAVAGQPGANPPRGGSQSAASNPPQGPAPASRPGAPAAQVPVDREFVARTLASLTDSEAVSRATHFDRASIAEGAVARIDALIGYVRDVVKPSKGTTDVPRFLFDIGTPSPKVLSALRNIDSEIADAAAQKVTLPSQVVDKTYRKNPKEADRLFSQLPKLLEEGEALRNKGNAPRWILTSPYETASGSAKHQIAIIEIAHAKDGAEIVSVHVAPAEKLNEIRKNPWTR